MGTHRPAVHHLSVISSKDLAYSLASARSTDPKYSEDPSSAPPSGQPSALSLATRILRATARLICLPFSFCDSSLFLYVLWLLSNL